MVSETGLTFFDIEYRMLYDSLLDFLVTLVSLLLSLLIVEPFMSLDVFSVCFVAF